MDILIDLLGGCGTWFVLKADACFSGERLQYARTVWNGIKSLKVRSGGVASSQKFCS